MARVCPAEGNETAANKTSEPAITFLNFTPFFSQLKKGIRRGKSKTIKIPGLVGG